MRPSGSAEKKPAAKKTADKPTAAKKTAAKKAVKADEPAAEAKAETVKAVAEAAPEVKAEKPAPKKAAAKKADVPSLKIRLVKSLAGRIKNQHAVAHSLGLRRIGDVTVQPDNAATHGKIAKITHLVEVTKA